MLEKRANFLNIEGEKLNQQVKDLSGGEKQRVAILRVFLGNSDFIFIVPITFLKFTKGFHIRILQN
ncbi:hypothetical protein V2P72_00095 [Mesomycoplasma hyopneumoniae]|nr:hypothetical protein [Mesomycoplasma hyopneumoniae]